MGLYGLIHTEGFIKTHTKTRVYIDSCSQKGLYTLMLTERFGGSTFYSNDGDESLGRCQSLPAVHSEMVKSLPILHVKIARVLQRLMGSSMD